MYNIIYLSLFIVVFVIQYVLLPKDMSKRFLIVLTAVSFAFLFIDIIVYFMFLDRIITIIFTVIFIISLTVLTLVSSKIPFDEVVINKRLFHIVFNTVLGFTLIVIIPSLLMLLNIVLWGRLLVIFGYLIFVLLYNIFLDVEYRNDSAYIVLLLVISVPLVIIGRQSFYKMNDVFDYFEIDSSIVREKIEYEVMLINPNISLDDWQYFQIEIYDSILYAYEVNGVESGSSGERVFTVIDLETEELLYGKSLNTVTGDYVRISDEDGHGIYEINGEVYIVTSEYILSYKDGEVDVFYTGEISTAFEKNGNLYFFNNNYTDDNFTAIFDGTNIVFTDEYSYHTSSDYRSNKNVLYSKIGYQEYEGYYVIEDDVYYGDEVGYINDELIVVGNYNEMYLSSAGVYKEINRSLTENLVSCGDMYYTTWRSSFIVNDYPSPMMFVLDKELSIESAYLSDGIYGLVCYDGELYGKTDEYKADATYDQSVFVRFDTSSTDYMERPIFTEYKLVFSSLGRSFLLVLVPFMKFSRYVIKKKKITTT